MCLCGIILILITAFHFLCRATFLKGIVHPKMVFHLPTTSWIQALVTSSNPGNRTCFRPAPVVSYQDTTVQFDLKRRLILCLVLFWFFLQKYPLITGFACTLHTEDQRDTMQLPVTKRWQFHYILVRSVDVQCSWHLKASWDMQVASLCTCSAQLWHLTVKYFVYNS